MDKNDPNYPQYCRDKWKGVTKPSYTEEDIAELRARWIGKEQLIGEVIEILKGAGKIEDAGDHDTQAQEAKRRLETANELLTENGFPDFDSEKSWLFIIDILLLDERGIDLSKRNCEEIFLECAHLEGAYLRCAHLEGADLSMAHLEGADLAGAHWEGANLRWAHLEGADLSMAHLEGADLSWAHVEGANLNNVHLGEITEFPEECKLDDNRKQELLKKKPKTLFYYNAFLPCWRGHFIEKKANIYEMKKPEFLGFKNIKWKNLLKHLFDRWNYTGFFGANIELADTTMAKDLHRYVQDQQYIARFKATHKWMYWFWKIFSDCGGKLHVVLFWSALFMLIYGLTYWASITESFGIWNSITPEWLKFSKTPINMDYFTERGWDLGNFWKSIFVSFDIFTNLGIRNIMPQTRFGLGLVISESLFGFMMLGMLISVMGERFARRS
jgi:hypothetical protein